jgi:hypothetical protein
MLLYYLLPSRHSGCNLKPLRLLCIPLQYDGMEAYFRGVSLMLGGAGNEGHTVDSHGEGTKVTKSKCSDIVAAIRKCQSEF